MDFPLKWNQSPLRAYPLVNIIEELIVLPKYVSGNEDLPKRKGLKKSSSDTSVIDMPKQIYKKQNI